MILLTVKKRTGEMTISRGSPRSEKEGKGKKGWRVSKREWHIGRKGIMNKTHQGTEIRQSFE